MITLLYAPDGSASWTGAGVLTLCNTSRTITELEVRLNHRRVISVEQLATALGSAVAALAQDQANWRNTLAMKIRRSVDFTAPTPVAFADPEGALWFALQQPTSFPTTGTLKISLVGAVGGSYAPLYLLNCGVEAIASNYNDLGIAPAFDYTFNGGLITTVSPF